jgi:hypothetical protein
VRPDSRNQKQKDVSQGESQGNAKHPGSQRRMRMAMGVAGVGMHGWSVRRSAPGIKFAQQ